MIWHSSQRKAAVVALAIICFVSQAWGGKLGKVREAIHGDSDSSSSDDDDDDDDERDSNQTSTSGSSGGDNSLWCLFPPVGLLICLPIMIVEPPEEQPSEQAEGQYSFPSAYFLSRPYANGHHGQLLMTRNLRRLAPVVVDDGFESITVYDPLAEMLAREKGLSTWSVRLAAEYALDFGPVHRPSLLASLDTVYRVGFTTDWTHYVEPLVGGGVDQLTIGALNLTYRIAGSEWAEVRCGLGVRLIYDGEREFGFNFTYLIDIFLSEPLTLSIVGDAGNLGKAFFAHGRFTLGSQLGPFEPYVGYDVVLIEGTAASVLFQGPLAGVRAWF